MKQIERFHPKGLLRTWGTEMLIGETSQYTGKVLTYQAGKAGGLQLHRRKDETFYLFSGEAWVDSEGDVPFVLDRVKMLPGQSYHIPAGAPHRFEAITDCVVFEVSTPVHNDRVRLEEHYGVEVIGGGYDLETTEP